jgi:hypothetical protein
MNRRTREWLLVVLVGLAVLLLLLSISSYIANPALELVLYVAGVSGMAIYTVLITRDMQRWPGREALRRALLWVSVPLWVLLVVVAFTCYFFE